MGSPSDRLSRRHLASRVPSSSLSYVQHRHVVGCYCQRGKRHILFRGSTPDLEEIQGHIYVVYLHDYCYACSRGRWASGSVGAISLADQFLYGALAIGYGCCESLFAAYCVESGFDDVYMVDIWTLGYVWLGVSFGLVSGFGED